MVIVVPRGDEDGAVKVEFDNVFASKGSVVKHVTPPRLVVIEAASGAATASNNNKLLASIPKIYATKAFKVVMERLCGVISLEEGC
jgi:hypothetical protein